jgi:hypothetical protein
MLLSQIQDQHFLGGENQALKDWKIIFGKLKIKRLQTDS